MFAFVFIVLAAFTISFFAAYRISINVMQEQRKSDTVKSFEQVETTIKSLLNNVENLSLLLQFEDAVIDFARYDLENIYTIENIKIRIRLANKIKSLLSSYDFISAVLIFKDNGVVGGSSSTRSFFLKSSSAKPHLFFSTGDYIKTTNNAPSIHWAGCYSKSYFTGYRGYNENGEQDYFILGMRAFKTRTRSGDICTSEIVLCLKESFIRNLYSKLADEEGNKVYILDCQGKYISGDPSKLGTTAGYFGKLDTDDRFGSVTIKMDQGIHQIVYYKLEGANWLLVNEVPMEIYTKNMVAIKYMMFLIALATTVLIAFLYTFWVGRIMAPLEKLAVTMSKAGQGDLDIRMQDDSRTYEIGLLNRQFNHMLDSLNALIKRNERTEAEKRELEIDALQSQINPHLIYNTIASIRWMAIMLKANSISDALASLVEMLRPIFSISEITWSVREELEFTRKYISVMEYRYGNQITFVITTDERALRLRTPRFILQPIVENNYIHGMAGRHKGAVHINVGLSQGMIVFTVRDDGKGIPEEKLNEIRKLLCSQTIPKTNSERNIGIYNVNKRLKLYYGDKYGLTITSEEGMGTSVEIRLPDNCSGPEQLGEISDGSDVKIVQ
jgi:sensor histidine kinase YesM